jgi:protein-S-isoprenylcysteine O-methyltransferase Ste14
VLIKELEHAGHSLFRYRSYVFFSLLPLAAAALLSRHSYLGISHRAELTYEIGCFMLSMLGLIVRMLSIGYAQPGTSGRNTREQVADALNTSGMYSICRHPLYLGNFLMAAGIFLSIGSYWLVIIGLLLYIIVYERIIIAEEGYLLSKFGESFKTWCANTPCVLPHFSAWRKGEWFSMKAAVRGEIYGFTVLVTMFYILNLLKNVRIERALRIEYFWTIFLAITIPTFFVIRFLRKHTRVMDSTEHNESRQ